MSMITKCPGCGTAFRVAPQHLQAQHGMVRCGRCATVFDGFKTLATLTEDAPLDTSSRVDAVSPVQPATVDAPVQPPVIEEPLTAPEPQRAAPQPETTFPAQPRPVATPEPQRTIAVETLDVGSPPKRRGGGWGFGVLLLLTTLAAQGAYFYRGEIAARVPELRPHLNKMCELLRCTVALPQRPRQISIEASDMQAIDPANPGLIILTATLRNQATTALSYPALDVVLTNTKDHTVARRIFLPAEYLDAGKDARAGIPPNAEVTVGLNLDSGELGAAGFRLDLLAAPAR